MAITVQMRFYDIAYGESCVKRQAVKLAGMTTLMPKLLDCYFC